MYKCIIPMNHFDFEENGVYELYYNNEKSELSRYYEVTPFNVILPERHMIKMIIKQEDNIYDISIGINGTLYFIMRNQY